MRKLTMDAETLLRDVVGRQPYALLFATISGAHLYGFPSQDSDYDLRGVHILPAREVLGLGTPRDTIEASQDQAGTLVDLVTHDAAKFFRLLLRRNGYVLEQVTSPIVVRTTPEHAELLDLVPGCITRHHAHHYLGFARNQWGLFLKERPRRLKPLLYVYRVVLSGIHLMRSGRIEANLAHLNADANLAFIPDLIAAKMATEHAPLDDACVSFHEREVMRLLGELEAAAESTALPDVPSAGPALSDLLVRLRLANV
jgi:predicted nucleotidyltransferase